MFNNYGRWARSVDKKNIKLMQPVLQAKAINKRYGKVVALDNADLELYKDEVLGVIGDNGIYCFVVCA